MIVVLDFILSFSKGAITGFSLGSPVEWEIHRDMLHAKQPLRNKIPFIDKASRGHHDNHHGAYKGPAHYYRDITNENEVIHFAKSDVGIIATVSAVVGGALASAFYLSGEEKNIEGAIGFACGVLTGAMAYYGTYEFTHHYMHVIGSRRLEINRVFGDKIQGGEKNRDGKLRISKPLLDDICNSIEMAVDDISAGSLYYTEKRYELAHRIKKNVEANIKNDVNIASFDTDNLIHETLDVMLEREREVREHLSIMKRFRYAVEREVQSTLRNSSTFQRMDNHHFLHHFRYDRNLNVVAPAMDYMMGTKEDSSVKRLTEDKRLWLCPNSPEIEPFKRKTGNERQLPEFIQKS